MTKTLFMETTLVDPLKTAGEIQGVLVRAGAKQIATTYEQGKAVGLAFTIRVPSGLDVLFALPVRVDPVYKVLLKRRRDAYASRVQQIVREQAERVAWRQLLRWVQAQVALIETNMVTPEEVFLPYLVNTATGRTLYEGMSAMQFKMLEAPSRE